MTHTKNSETTQEAAALTLRRGDGDLEVLFRGRVILRHGRKSPCLTAGRGEGVYHMIRGHFSVHDSNLRRFDAGDARVLTEKADEISISVAGAGAVTIRAEDREARLWISDVPEGTNRIWLSLEMERARGIYGCGEQYTFLNLKGRKVPIWVQEQGIGRAHDLVTVLANLRAGAGGHWYNTYYPQPSFVTSSNMACVCHTAAYAEFNFRPAHRAVLHFWEVPEEVQIYVDDDDPANTVGFISRKLGRAPALPEWLHDGMVLGVQGGTEAVAEKYRQARDAGVRVAGLWVQDWEGKRETTFGRQLFWDWKYDRKLYPDLPKTIADYAAEGVRFLGYINPYLALEGELYREASEKGYCVRRPSGEDYYIPITSFSVAIVDLTNPEAFEWLKGVIKREMIGIGLAGWMADFGEYLPVDCVLHSGEDPQRAHNRWPTLWARLNYEAVEEEGKLGEIMFFMRAGYSGSSGYATAYWAGDQLVNWSFADGLATVIPASISIGMSGVGYMHSDIGGYTSLGWVKRGKRLFARWTELATFAPIMRSHEGNRPDSNWQFHSDRDTLRHLARMTSLFAELKPYQRHLVEEYSERGLPPIRHPFIHYPEDPQIHRNKYQFMYGSELLVAPVRRPFRRAISAYLPEDEWVHLWTGKEYGGGWHRIAAPVGRPAVFYRKRGDFAELFAAIPGRVDAAQNEDAIRRIADE